MLFTCHCGQTFDGQPGMLVGCPACGSPIQMPLMQAAQPPTTVVHIHQPAPRHDSGSPGVGAVLSFFVPGLGQMYRGNVLGGLLWLVIVTIGYICLIVPGILLHLVCIFGAASKKGW